METRRTVKCYRTFSLYVIFFQHSTRSLADNLGDRILFAFLNRVYIRPIEIRTQKQHSSSRFLLYSFSWSGSVVDGVLACGGSPLCISLSSVVMDSVETSK